MCGKSQMYPSPVRLEWHGSPTEQYRQHCMTGRFEPDALPL